MSEEVGLSQAVRDALRVNGTGRGKEMLNKIRAWIVSSYPHLASKVDSPTFSTTLVNQRKKIAEEKGETGEPSQERPVVVVTTKRPRPAKAPVVPATEGKADPLLTFAYALAELKDLAAKVGGKEVMKVLVDLI